MRPAFRNRLPGSSNSSGDDDKNNTWKQRLQRGVSADDDHGRFEATWMGERDMKSMVRIQFGIA